MHHVTYPKKKRYLLAILVYMIVLSTIFLSSAEYICRKTGIRPWKINKINITVTPGGKFFTPHPTLGYTHLPGQFTVSLGNGYSFSVTHREDTFRITHPLETYPAQPGKPAIWIFGCSFTHGWSLNDQETYPWVLQQRLPHYEIVNFGVTGYGTIHALRQFQEAVETSPPPQIAVIAYASFHDERNTFLRKRRKAVAPYNSLGPVIQPYARLKGENLEIAVADVAYRPFPLMRYSAFSHFLEHRYNKIEDRFYRSHDVTKAIIVELARLAKKYGVQLIVAGMTADAATHDIIEYARTVHIIAGDISVDLRVNENRNLPYDSHPSAQANKLYAEKLFELLHSNRLVQEED